MLGLTASTFILVAMLGLTTSTFVMVDMLDLTALTLYWWLCLVDIDGKYVCGSGRNGWKDSPITLFQLYQGEQFSWWKKPEYSKRTTNHGQATGELYHVLLVCS
jgi:hypothetical protein